MNFELHPQLAADTEWVCDLPLCRVVLMNDANYPWLILVPRRAQLRESYQLAAAERDRLWREVDAVAALLAEHTGADKMNIAALGNHVPQLHVHCIARFGNDAAWPRPVWGVVPPRRYDPEPLADRLRSLAELLQPLQKDCN